MYLEQKRTMPSCSIVLWINHDCEVQIKFRISAEQYMRIAT